MRKNCGGTKSPAGSPEHGPGDRSGKEVEYEKDTETFTLADALDLSAFAALVENG